MYNLDLFVIAIYCFIEDDLYPAFCKVHGKPRRAGFDPGLSDAECLTIEIVGHFLGYSSQKKLYEQMKEHFIDWFPTLKDLPASHPLSDRISAIEDLQRLKQLHRAAIQVSNLDEFGRMLDSTE